MKNRPKLLAHELSKKSLPNTKSFKRWWYHGRYWMDRKGFKIGLSAK
jgi:hypothetical protein